MRRTTLLLAGLSATVAVGAEWMRAPGWILAIGLVASALLTVFAVRGEKSGAWTASAGAGIAAVLAATALIGTRRLTRIEHHWREVREEAVSRASDRLGGELDAAVALARSLADEAARVQDSKPLKEFGALARLLRRGGPSHGIVLFDPQGHPRSWAGIQRTAIPAAGPELSVITTSFYLWLVARRQTSAGTAAAVVLLARGDDVPRVGTALTDRFVQRTGVGLRFLDPAAAPADSDVFDYVWPGRADTLFAVQPVPPSRDAAWEAGLRDARRPVALLLAALLVVAGAIAVRTESLISLMPAAAAAVAIARAPLRETLARSSVLFAPTYVQGLLGPFSSTAGALLLTGVVVFVIACTLWQRGLAPTWWRRLLAFLGAVTAPYILQTLARGITPPLSGVRTAQWVAWQAALVIAAGAIVLLAAALVRGREVPRPATRWSVAAASIALVATVLGLVLWQPLTGWPWWYAYVWTIPLLIALKPMPIRTTMATVAIVAGSSAALLTWGATTEGRMDLAAEDLTSLGDQPGSPLTAEVEALARGMRVDSAPRSPGDLFVLWRKSELAARGYPAVLAVWGPTGQRMLELRLAELAVPEGYVAQVATAAAEDGTPRVQPVVIDPGVHVIAATPLRDGRIVTVTVGPRTRLIPPSRLSRFLMGQAGEPDAPYEVVLAPASAQASAVSGVEWRREGWLVRGEHSVVLREGVRHGHAIIDLRGPSALLQRGALLLVLDVLALALLWAVVEVASGRAGPALRRGWPRAARSLRVRLSVSLALFFVAPTLAFALWSFGRLEDEFRGARQLLVQRTLQDAGGVLASAPLNGDSAMMVASQRVDAELMVSRDGVLWATSAPVLADLGMVDLLVPDEIYPRLAFGDEVELASDQRAVPAPVLVGYRVMDRADPGGVSILAAPEYLGDRNLRRREADLGIALLVAGVLGCLAAFVLSGLAAQTLARPLQQLRRAALAVGSGEAPDIDPADVPTELEPIRGALAQAAADVEAGHRAQRVLAWGEMARQIAHEIKNPLTPIRLGIQHLLRVSRDKPQDVPAVLAPTGERILAEIERLDGIARAFSRFALPGAEAVPVEAVDVAAVVRDVVKLYQVGEGATAWDAEADDALRALARRDELAEVLVNLCENARDAGAARVVIAARRAASQAIIDVRDDGRGIPPELMGRIFEPRFSATTSGSGLGLAIAKRLVESWGGSITVEPAEKGTTVRLTLRCAS